MRSSLRALPTLYSTIRTGFAGELKKSSALTEEHYLLAAFRAINPPAKSGSDRVFAPRFLLRLSNTSSLPVLLHFLLFFARISFRVVVKTDVWSANPERSNEIYCRVHHECARQRFPLLSKGRFIGVRPRLWRRPSYSTGRLYQGRLRGVA